MSGNQKIDVIVDIRNNETGEVRSYESVEYKELGDTLPSVFNWAQNNYLCDCNRRDFWRDAGGDLQAESPCGEGGFSVRLTIKGSGFVYYDEISG